MLKNKSFFCHRKQNIKWSRTKLNCFPIIMMHLVDKIYYILAKVCCKICEIFTQTTQTTLWFQKYLQVHEIVTLSLCLSHSLSTHITYGHHWIVNLKKSTTIFFLSPLFSHWHLPVSIILDPNYFRVLSQNQFIGHSDFITQNSQN